MDNFKNNALKFVLETTKFHIKNGFDINDKCNKTFSLKNEIYEIIIHKNCFHSDDISYSYFEDYCVHFKGRFKNKKISSSFYMEWEDNQLNKNLIPANTRWNPVTGIFSNRNIKIRYVNESDDEAQ
jgi:hypothetical protein